MRPSESKHVVFGESPDSYCVHLSVNKTTGECTYEIKDPAAPKGSRIRCSGRWPSLSEALEQIRAWIEEHKEARP